MKVKLKWMFPINIRFIEKSSENSKNMEIGLSLAQLTPL